MHGDTLTICLFFAGLAATFGVAAVSQAGWKHWTIVSVLFAMAAASAVIAIGWAWRGDQWPSLAASFRPVADSPVAWFFVLLFALAGVAIPDWRRSRMPTGRSDSGVHPNQKADAIRVEFGTGGRFERVDAFDNGVVQWVMYIAVHNQGDGFLSGCAVTVTRVAPPARMGQLPVLLMKDFDLMLGA